MHEERQVTGKSDQSTLDIKCAIAVEVVTDKWFPDSHIYERDKLTCQYCGFKAVDFESWWIAHFHVDHIKPICHSGTDSDDNKVLACSSCNNYKGGFDCDTLEQAREYVKRRREIAEANYNRWFG